MMMDVDDGDDDGDDSDAYFDTASLLLLSLFLVMRKMLLFSVPFPPMRKPSRPS